MTPQEIGRQLAAVAAALAQARDEAEGGAWLDLDGLGERVRTVCDAALALAPEEARPLLARLEAVVDALDSLAAVLARQRDALAAAGPVIGPHTARRRAVAAYGAAPPPGPADPPDRPDDP
ncbi:hypothetical protein [Azospirillum halopraeferens]|uniref:hypothetical protein n=1 Tax=Azospirillum halopraeferens TaxID=34010 RepID=UPI0004086619|nr:hypothetical protein [Azospirillum halopraeferens]